MGLLHTWRKILEGTGRLYLSKWTSPELSMVWIVTGTHPLKLSRLTPTSSTPPTKNLSFGTTPLIIHWVLIKNNNYQAYTGTELVKFLLPFWDRITCIWYWHRSETPDIWEELSNSKLPVVGVVRDIISRSNELNVELREELRAVSYTHLTLPTTPYV